MHNRIQNDIEKRCTEYSISSSQSRNEVSFQGHVEKVSLSGNNIYIYIYMCVCVCVLIGPVKPELGVIPSGQENHSRAEHLNYPGWELK